ncbi:MAG: PQQ-dependent sugar dehydrogenase [Pirellulaceae bacterium]
MPWTTSNFRGRPDPPPPYRALPVFPNLRFSGTTVLAYEASLDRFFVGQRDGKVFVLPRDRSADKADLFLDASKLVQKISAERDAPVAFESLYGMTFDPEFEKNRYVYVCYVVRNRDRDLGQLEDGTRVCRFRVSDTDPPRCEVESETLIIAWLQGGHNGGCIEFGHDGCLYISSGDGGFAFPPDGRNSGQDLSRLLSKVLRIDVRHEEQGRPYAIPADNPFVDFENARGETWSYGMRNPWKMSFDRETGELWVGDVGWELWELVYRVNKGDNYGWSIVEGSQPVHTERKIGPTPIVPPLMEIPHTEGASITGGYVYRGKRFPELVGSYVFGDWETRRIWSVKVDGDQVGPRRELIDPTVRIVDFTEDADGELYLLDHDDGSIYTFTPNPDAGKKSNFPRRLSETGLFTSVVDHVPAPGVVPFSVNVEQWSDHATAERMIGVPGVAAIRIHEKPEPIPGSQFRRATDYPTDTVLLKTLSLEMVAGDPTSSRRIETQAMHYDGREWQGYTYEWNDAQTDAVLVERLGENRTFEVEDPRAPGGRRQQTWRFASRNECLRCHNPWSEYALAFNLSQLNRVHDYGRVSDNQIRTLRHIGLLEDVVKPKLPGEPPPKEPWPRSPEALPRLTPPFDASASLDQRARSYLHVNCAHCHRFNGGGSSYLYLQHELSLLETKAVGVRPTQGAFGIHDAEIVAPGDPYRSVMLFRLSKTGPGHMPHLGSKIVDDRAVALIHDWIRQAPPRLEDQVKIDRLIELDESASLARQKEDQPRTVWQLAARAARPLGREAPNADELAEAEQKAAEQAAAAVASRRNERSKLVGELLAAPPTAMMLAEATRQGRLPAGVRDLVMKTALANDTDAAIRDLFEAFVPEEQRTKRLGDVIQPDAILQLEGDLSRGRRLFHESTVVQCRSCHRSEGKGTQLGPDLDAIGKKYDRGQLLESILEPSKKIDPKFAMWLVETNSGKLHTGLLLERGDDGVVLKDAQNKVHRITANEIDGVYPQTKSIMPDMLLRDFTAQQVADLLAYLASLRDEPVSP